MRLSLLILLASVALGRATNPFMAFVDDIDHASEETKQPTTEKGWLYVLLMPWVGLGMFVLSFPVLWWNERRATGRKATPPSGAATGGTTPVVKGEATNEKGADAEAPGTVVGHEASHPERHSLLANPTQAYEETVDDFETRVCTPLCCRMVRKCFESMPELTGYGDARTYAFRVIGVMMMFTGIDLFLSPTYFLVHSLWFFGFIVGLHLALCACKGACLCSLGTMGTSYIIHRPGIVLLLATSIVGVSALSIYYNVPTHGAAAAAHR